ncbi:MAG: S8 family serine peptidase [Acidobacteria bacterium]|nr:S8 family serine peptidase [Acidobacteriota bacterium]
MRNLFPPRIRFVAVLLALLALLSLSQDSSFITAASRPDEAKLDAELRQLYRQRSSSDSRQRETLPSHIRHNEREDLVGVIVKLQDDSEAAQNELRAKGFRVRARVGDIAVAEIPVDELPNLAGLAAVKQLHAAKFKSLLSDHKFAVRASSKAAAAFANDAANAAIKAPEARATLNMTGRNVVIGLIDSGIDWRHGDFRTADGKTRIKALWDMSDNSGTGPNGVGRIYSETDINAALQTSGVVNERDLNGHGTHVAGTAAGNGLGTGGSVSGGTFTGIAPDADLIVVKATRSNSAQATFADDDLIAALAFINEQATAANKPFVINFSIGGHYSAHDGSDPIEQAVDNLLASGKGKQVVIAAGNEGDDNIHASGILPENGETTIPFSVTNKAEGMLAIYQGSDAVSARIVKPNGTIVGPVSLYGLITSDPDVELENAPGESVSEPKAVLVTFKQRLAGQWKLILKGTRINNGRYDVWTQDAGGTQLAPGVSDGLSSVASPATARRAISVGNFVTKTEYVDLNGVTRTRTQQGGVGQLAISSSLGPSRDGRLTPMLTAPGSYLASTRSADYTVDSYTGGAVLPENLTNDDGKHYVAFGTSMSAATVTGTVALMLQANRNLDPGQIKRFLLRTVTNDRFTGASVSPQFGYGKLNTLEAVKAVIDNLAVSEFVSVSGASFVPENIGAPEMIMSGFGMNLTTTNANASSSELPTVLGNVSVKITDAVGTVISAPLFYVSPNQINYLVPNGLALGVAKTEVVAGDGRVVARGAISINSTWPGLFADNQSGTGMAAANVLRIKANGTQIIESIQSPINLSIPGDKVYLQLYGTGLRGRTSLNNVKLTLGGTPLNVEYTGAQLQFFGLDQINAVVPTSLAGRNRTLDLVLYVNGWAANIVQCKVQ